MRSIILLFAAVALTASLAGAADAQKLDKNGRCHDTAGKFAKAEVCGGAPKTAAKTATPVPAAAPAMKAAPAKGAKCKNDKGKFAKCGTPGAHPA
jgi:hypothetical protein